MSGCALIVLFWALLRHTVKPEALVLGVVLLAVQADLVMLSRMAIPEMASMLAQLVSYALVVAGRASRGRMILAGVVLAAAVGFKATTVLVLPIFLVMIPVAARLRTAVWGLARPATVLDRLRRPGRPGGVSGILALFQGQRRIVTRAILRHLGLPETRGRLHRDELPL